MKLQPFVLQIGGWEKDVDAEANRLRERGMKFSGPTNKPWGCRVIDFADPIGHQISLYAPIPEQEPRTMMIRHSQ